MALCSAKPSAPHAGIDKDLRAGSQYLRQRSDRDSFSFLGEESEKVCGADGLGLEHPHFRRRQGLE